MLRRAGRIALLAMFGTSTLTLAGCMERFFFYPDSVPYTAPAQFGLRAEDVELRASDGLPVFQMDKAAYAADVTNTIGSRGCSFTDKAYVDSGEDPLYTRDGWFVVLSLPIQGHKNGKLMWEYHAQGIGLGNAPRFPGDWPSAVVEYTSPVDSHSPWNAARVAASRHQ